jgi:acetoacetate decarboxylase
MPVRVRTANLHSAMFSVPAAPTQRLIDYSGLRVCEYLPGRAIINLMLMRYVDGDLGQYHEFGTCVMVNQPGSHARGPQALASAAAFIHHLPVDQAFTLEAGQRIWGFPKEMADFTVRDGNQFGFDVSIGGALIAGMEFGRGLPAPAALTSRSQVLRTYSHTDGITREIPWEMKISGMRGRIGGAKLWLGDHPYAAELASLGLPKRALVSQSAANVEMTFGDAHVID